MWARNGAVPYVCSSSVPGPFGRQETDRNRQNRLSQAAAAAIYRMIDGDMAVETTADGLSFRQG